MMFLCTIGFFFAVTGSSDGSRSLVVASAVIRPSSGSYSFWGGMNDNYRRDDNDVPIIRDNLRSRTKRKRRRDKRRIDDNHDHDTDDSDDDVLPPFFVDEEENSRWREQYDFDRKMRRRNRNNNRHRKETDEIKGLFGAPSPLRTFREWTYTKTGVRIPRILFHFDPITILKIRKSWHNVVPWAIVRIGADFEMHHRLGGGLWRLRGCLEDKFLGGRFTMKGKRNGDKGVVVEYSKSWLFAGAGSLATRFNLSAQYDIQSNRGSARFGFRTENIDSVGTLVSSPGIFGGSGRRQCFTVVPIIPLDGPDGHFMLEAKTSIELPEPEIVVGVDLGGDSVDGGSVEMGVGGDIDVEIEELNVICHL
ncbi:hypothetical protein HJC23_006895 [Cyclotella cryptica]|uniref:Uncharacterized protein n=1 Tax=Cyclotella cryptica TaxID=29204 RepID=A0ABD3QCN1_9STRA|eukprot:CCRYP_006725-RA/>CCRYP_006725-RA protein AED:0.03 eAED:0.03 QI:828/1/1/1/1/1/2/74/362